MQCCHVISIYVKFVLITEFYALIHSFLNATPLAQIQMEGSDNLHNYCIKIVLEQKINNFR